jgi:hypothetical protein
MLHCQDGGRRKRGKENLSRDKSVLDPPSPIPNLEVKQYSVDGTTAARLWESRPLRGDPLFFLLSKPVSVLRPFASLRAGSSSFVTSNSEAGEEV